MHPNDRPLLDKSITRLDLARQGRMPCCGSQDGAMHRGGCRVSVADLMSWQQALREWEGDNHADWIELNR